MRFLFFALLLLTALPAFAAEKESVYDRVMRTETIRCAYASFDPTILIDPETGDISGIFYDLMGEIGKRLHLNIAWSEEVGYGVIEEGFRAGRYDAFCGAVSPTPERARGSVFTLPAFYSPVGVWVRADDTRFDGDYTRLNAPEYRIATKDGDLQDTIARLQFPRAQRVAIPQMADTTQNLLDVVMGKADAVFVEPYYAINFMKSRPGSLKNIAVRDPIRVFPYVFMLPVGEFQLKTMIDTVMQELLFTGYIDDLVMKYTGDGNIYYPVSNPYEVPR